MSLAPGLDVKQNQMSWSTIRMVGIQLFWHQLLVIGCNIVETIQLLKTFDKKDDDATLYLSFFWLLCVIQIRSKILNNVRMDSIGNCESYFHDLKFDGNALPL